MKKWLLPVFLLPVLAFAQNNEPKHILPGHSNDLDAIAVSSQGYIATGSWDKNILIYKDDSTYKQLRTLGGNLGTITALRFSKDGKLLASATNDNGVRVWDSTFKNIKVLEGHKAPVNALMFDNTRKYLFSGGEDKTIIVWEVASGKQVKTINNLQSVNAIVQNPMDSRQVFVAGAEPKIKIYNMVNNQVLKTLDGHTDVVNAIDISRNGNYLISGSNDKSARIWDLKTGKELRKLPVDCWKVTAVAFTDDSKYAVTGCNDGSVKVWEVETGKLISSTDGGGHYVRDIAFSKTTGDVLVANMLKSSEDYGLRVWHSGIEKPKPGGMISTKPGTDKPAAASPAPAVKPSNAVPKK